jgi:hypothetical protein
MKKISVLFILLLLPIATFAAGGVGDLLGSVDG